MIYYLLKTKQCLLWIPNEVLTETLLICIRPRRLSGLALEVHAGVKRDSDVRSEWITSRQIVNTMVTCLHHFCTLMFAFHETLEILTDHSIIPSLLHSCIHRYYHHSWFANCHHYHHYNYHHYRRRDMITIAIKSITMTITTYVETPPLKRLKLSGCCSLIWLILLENFWKKIF